MRQLFDERWCSVVVVTLTAFLSSYFVEIEWEIDKLAVSVNFSNDVTVAVVFHFDGWSTKAVIVFVVVGGSARISSIMTGWGFVVASLEAVLTCFVKCGKWMRPSVVSMTRLLFLIKCNRIIGPVNFFITMKWSAEILSPFSNSSVVIANSVSKWLLVSEIWEERRNSEFYSAFHFHCFQVILVNCTEKRSWVHQSI